MAKWQKVVIAVPKKFGPTERKAISQEIIEFIRKRTKDESKDKDNRKFPNYSSSYAKEKGVSRGDVDLTLSQEMLDELSHLSDSSGAITIGYDKGDSTLNGKVEGNRIGSYGRPTGNKKKARDFLGIHKDDLKRILSKYKEGGRSLAEEELAAKAAAEELVAGIDFELSDE